MDTFLGLLEEVTHDGFMAGVAGLTTLTLAFLAIAVSHILPKHKKDNTLPPRRRLK
jgi:hypothetical protein